MPTVEQTYHKRQAIKAYTKLKRQHATTVVRKGRLKYKLRGGRRKAIEELKEDE